MDPPRLEDGDRDRAARWLERVHAEAGLPAPAVETSAAAVRVLVRLADASERRERRAREVLAARRRHAAELRAARETEERALRSAGLDVPGRGAAAELAAAAVALGLSRVSPAELYAAASLLRERCEAAAAAAKEEQARAARAADGARAAAKELAAARQLARRADTENEARRADTDARRRERPYLKEKRRQYAEAAGALRERVHASGVCAELTHSELVRTAAATDAARAELVPLQERLAAYRSLPPDAAMARVKAEGARQRLAALEERVADEIRGMGFVG